MSVIIGIDPGSRVTGFGVLSIEGRQCRYLDCGTIRVSLDEEMPTRLIEIHQGIRELVQRYSPTSAAIEQVFMHQNAASALKLGQARGVAIVALGLDGIPVSEYSARQVKQAVVGYGGADKTQVQQMIKMMLNLNQAPQADAADALGIALCHFHTHYGLHAFQGARKIARGRVQ